MSAVLHFLSYYCCQVIAYRRPPSIESFCDHDSTDVMCLMIYARRRTTPGRKCKSRGLTKSWSEEPSGSIYSKQQLPLRMSLEDQFTSDILVHVIKMVILKYKNLFRYGVGLL